MDPGRIVLWRIATVGQFNGSKFRAVSQCAIRCFILVQFLPTVASVTGMYFYKNAITGSSVILVQSLISSDRSTKAISSLSSTKLCIYMAGR